jgi:hypothetical protein
MKILIAIFFVFAAICLSAADANDFATCVVEDTYDEGETTCYVDSVNGTTRTTGCRKHFQ